MGSGQMKEEGAGRNSLGRKGARSQSALIPRNQSNDLGMYSAIRLAI